MGILSSLGSLGTKLIGRSGATMLIGSGLSLASYAAIATATTAMLSQAVGFFSGLPSVCLSLVLLCGAGQALSLIGAALLTRAAIQAANLGLTKTTG